MLIESQLMKVEERCFKNWLMEQYKILTTGRETISGEWGREVSKKERETREGFDPESK